MIKGILFDFDGTLADSIPLIMRSFQEACRKILGHELPEKQIIDTFGLSLPDAMKELAENPEQIDPLRAVYREFFYENHDAMIQSLEGIEETIAALYDKGIAMAVVTSKKHPMALRSLVCVGLDKYIPHIVAFGDTEHAKPHPEPMEAAAARMGLKPQECLCVGDSPFDLISGRAAGATTVAVSYTTFDWKLMEQEGRPDYVVDHLRELIPLIESLNNAQTGTK